MTPRVRENQILQAPVFKALQRLRELLFLTHFPFQTGDLFSTKALKPSIMSSVRIRL
jgi:hypothetical protein